MHGIRIQPPLVKAATSCILSAVLFSSLSSAHAAPSAAPLNKDAAAFCFSSLTASEQSAYYGRIVNLGASFSHGCVGCDSTRAEAQTFELTGDNHFFRRNPFTRFLFNARWKDPLARPSGAFVVENDPLSKPLGLVPAWQAKSVGYTGVWHHDRLRDDAQLLTSGEVAGISSTGVLADAQAVGGIATRFDLKVRSGDKHGVGYFTYAFRDGRYVPLQSVIDFAVDGGRLQDIFSTLAPDIFAKLEAVRWKDEALRAEAARTVASRIAATRPGLVFAIDVLFWDSVTRTLAITREKGTDSLVLKFILALLERTPVGRDMFDSERNALIRGTFYDALAHVSRGEAGAPGTPVLLSRLLDDAASRLRAKGYAPIIAALIGEFAARATGQNIASALLDWLRTETSLSAPYSVGQKFTSFVDPTKKSEFENHRLNRLTALDLPDIALDAAQKNRVRKALADFDVAMPLDPTGRVAGASSSSVTQAIVTALLFDLLKETDAVLDNLSAAMNETNAVARAATARSDNGILLIDYDEFFENFGAFLKPQTMHPTVAGAQRLGDMLERAVCKSKGQSWTP